MYIRIHTKVIIDRYTNKHLFSHPSRATLKPEESSRGRDCRIHAQKLVPVPRGVEKFTTPLTIARLYSSASAGAGISWHDARDFHEFSADSHARKQSGVNFAVIHSTLYTHARASYETVLKSIMQSLIATRDEREREGKKLIIRRCSRAYAQVHNGLL